MRTMHEVAAAAGLGLASVGMILANASSLVGTGSVGRLVAAGAASGASWLVARPGLRVRQHRSGVGCGGTELLWQCDARGRLTWTSPQFLDVLGYTPAQARRMHLIDVAHPVEHVVVAELLRGGRGFSEQAFRCLDHRGAEVWLAGNATPLRSRRGRFSGFAGSAREVSGEAAPAHTHLLATTRAEVRAVIDDDAVKVVFQPIVCLVTGRVLGVEALSRFSQPGSSRTPEDWFTDAVAVGLGIELELHAARRALRDATRLPTHPYISINLSPEALLDPAATTLLTSGEHVPASRIVLELTERTPVADYARLKEALAPLRAAGVRLAVDDAGAGYANFRHIVNLAPHLIKIDRSLITGIEGDSARRALLSAVVTFAHGLGATVVAEGLEESDELAACRSLDVDAGQGYLLGPPATDPFVGPAPVLPGPTASAQTGPLRVCPSASTPLSPGEMGPRSAVAVADRITAVQSYCLPGHAGDADLDGLVMLTTRLLQVPMAAFNLVGPDHQCYPAEHGLGLPNSHVPDELSFCSYVVARRTPVTIADARTHPVFSRNRFVASGAVVSYLGVPVIDEDGYVLGTFCAFDRRPQVFTHEDRLVLETLAGLARAQLSLRRRMTAQRRDVDPRRVQNKVLE